MFKPNAFDIRNFVENLTPTKSKNRYVCPVCGGNNLTINQKTGAYQCWNGCFCAEIREALTPKQKEKNLTYYTNPVKKIRNVIPAPVESEVLLAFLPSPPLDVPQKKTPSFYPSGVPLNSEEIRYLYSSTQWVSRFEWKQETHPKGYEKTYRLGHINEFGDVKWSKGENPWKCYRLQEAKSLGQQRWILGVEGEKVVEVIREKLHLVVITWQSSNWTEKELVKALEELKQANPAGLIYLRDNDETGIDKAQAIWLAAAKVQLPCLLLEPTAIWSEMPPKGDLADWIDWGLTEGLSRSDLVAILTRESQKEQENRIIAENNVKKHQPQLNWLQIAFERLFSGQHWITVLGITYCWNGKYYEVVEDVILTRKIAEHLNEFEVENNYPFAKPSCVKQVLLWAKQQTGVTPKEINPPGLNLQNGILQITWTKSDPKKPSSTFIPKWCLVPHDPSYYYTYCSEAVYQPDADPAECQRLLSALDAPQQDLFLKLIGASLDLPQVRQYHGRNIRAVLAQGTGSNGKDAFREVVKQLFGNKGITACTLSDFQQYDSGRKFPLYPLGTNPKINWSSENTKYANIDNIQSLKQAITGDPLSIERKGKDETEIDPACILIFNINDPPRMLASLEAIKSRYAVLSFNKTFKTNPDPQKGELKADPRFKYSPKFIQQKILPAFLNQVLDGLTRLMLYGIDYSSTQAAFLEIQRESDHLIAFCQDVNLDYQTSGLTPIQDIWNKLQEWYLENGTKEVITMSDGEEKIIWHPQAANQDKTIKAVNQVRSRFLSLFPQAKVVRVQNKTCISGIGFVSLNPNSNSSINLSLDSDLCKM